MRASLTVSSYPLFEEVPTVNSDIWTIALLILIISITFFKYSLEDRIMAKTSEF